MSEFYLGALLVVLAANATIFAIGWLAKAPTHPAIVPGIVLPPAFMDFDSITMQVCTLVVFVPFTVANIFEGVRPGFYTGRGAATALSGTDSTEGTP